jgi:hypothetical protein
MADPAAEPSAARFPRLLRRRKRVPRSGLELHDETSSQAAASITAELAIRYFAGIDDDGIMSDPCRFRRRSYLLYRDTIFLKAANRDQIGIFRMIDPSYCDCERGDPASISPGSKLVEQQQVSMSSTDHGNLLH